MASWKILLRKLKPRVRALAIKAYFFVAFPLNPRIEMAMEKVRFALL
jgi:hypothetical protein